MKLKPPNAGHVNAGDLVANVDGTAVPYHAWPGASENTEEARLSFAASFAGVNVVPWVHGAVIPSRRPDEPLEINTGTFEAVVLESSKGMMVGPNLTTGVLELVLEPKLAVGKVKEVLGFRNKSLVTSLKKKG